MHSIWQSKQPHNKLKGKKKEKKGNKSNRRGAKTNKQENKMYTYDEKKDFKYN